MCISASLAGHETIIKKGWFEVNVQNVLLHQNSTMRRGGKARLIQSAGYQSMIARMIARMIFFLRFNCLLPAILPCTISCTVFGCCVCGHDRNLWNVVMVVCVYVSIFLHCAREYFSCKRSINYVAKAK